MGQDNFAMKREVIEKVRKYVAAGKVCGFEQLVAGLKLQSNFNQKTVVGILRDLAAVGELVIADGVVKAVEKEVVTDGLV